MSTRVGNGIVTVDFQGIDRLRYSLGQGLAKGVRAELRKTVDRLAVELQGVVKASYLTGPRPTHLGVLSGTLRRSINIKRTDTPTSVGARVGTNLLYGAAWELGNVRVFASGAIGGHVPGRTRSEAAKQRARVTAPARPFLAPAYAQLREHIKAEIGHAIGRAVKGQGGLLGR